MAEFTDVTGAITVVQWLPYRSAHSANLGSKQYFVFVY